ncbi:MAG: HAD family hydrolase [Campylobacterota bacterium]|nr:HAD family hydrolase [Campylobacterota bacterium]
MGYKALFLDRDGIINLDHGYVYKIEDFEFTKGIFELVSYFIKHDFLIFIVTNQSGIGRGYYTTEDFNTLTSWMLSKFKEHQITIREVYHCPHTPEAQCHCRKPNIGMIEDCLNHYTIDLNQSWLIGDKPSDIQLALNAKIGKSIAISKTNVSGSTYTFPNIKTCQEIITSVKI